MPTVRQFILICFVFLNFKFFSQQVIYSRDFASVKAHVPIQIIDENPESFCVLRYNRKIHDFTVERRNKATFEITQFAALSLDSINANWFDYENLNYLFFENNKQLYFVFEKILNKKKTLYYKRIDSSGKAGTFINIATLEKDENTKDITFHFQRVGANQLLVVGESFFNNATAKKVVMLFNVDLQKPDQMVKLPLENQMTGFSGNYCYKHNRLYYTMSNRYPAGYRKKYTINNEMLVPFEHTQFISLNFFDLTNNEQSKTTLCLSDRVEIKSNLLTVSATQVNFDVCYVQTTNEKNNLMFMRQGFSLELKEQQYCRTNAMDTVVSRQLNFFDGSDKAEAAEKAYRYYQSLETEKYTYLFNERSDGGAFDEVLLWRANNRNGDIDVQKIIPRKMFYFIGRTRYQHIQELAFMPANDDCYVLFLEHKSNSKIPIEDFNHQMLKKLKHLSAANLMLLHLKSNAECGKEVIFRNGTYQAIPLKFIGQQNEFVFYLRKKGKEKFAILPLPYRGQ